jgi:hypothetical protein
MTSHFNALKTCSYVLLNVHVMESCYSSLYHFVVRSKHNGDVMSKNLSTLFMIHYDCVQFQTENTQCVATHYFGSA